MGGPTISLHGVTALKYFESSKLWLLLIPILFHSIPMIMPFWKHIWCHCYDHSTSYWQTAAAVVSLFIYFSLDKVLTNNSTHCFSLAYSFHECSYSHCSRTDGEPDLSFSHFLLFSFSPSEVYVFIVCLVIFGGNHYWAKCVLWTFSPVWRTAEMRGQCPDFLWHGGELSVSAALNPSRIYRRPPRKVKQPPRRGTRINKKLNSSSWQPEECLVRVCWKFFTLIRADHQSHKRVFFVG